MNVTEKRSLTPLYVIGFPKSGNTWLARMLAEMTQSNIAVNNSLDIVNAADNSPKRCGQYLIHKLHVVRDVESILGSKIVYIVRDVRDVMVSWFFHCNRWVPVDKVANNSLYKLYLNYEVRRSIDCLNGNIISASISRIRRLLKLLIYSNSNEGIIGGWSDHVSFWKQQPGIIFVKYEELLNNTESEMRRVLSALNIEVSDELMKRVIFNQSFVKKRADFLSSGDDKNVRFLRKGQVGDWRHVLPPHLVKQIENEHGKVMLKAGYKLVSNRQPDK